MNTPLHHANEANGKIRHVTVLDMTRMAYLRYQDDAKGMDILLELLSYMAQVCVYAVVG